MEDAQDHARVRLFPPAVPLATVLAGIALQYAWPIEAGFLLPPPWRYWIGGLIIAAAFLGLGLWSNLIFYRSGQSANPWKTTPEIVQHGPFRLTRNPMYLQLVLICIGIAIIAMNVWILILTPLCIAVLQRFAILPEERYLERKFGAAYLAYKARVRRWL